MTETADLAASLPEPQRPGLLRALRGWLLDYAYVTYWWLRAFFGRTSPEVYLHPETGPRAPVLIIPGVYESWRFMQPVAEHLFRAGHPVHVLDKLGFNTGAIPAMGEIVREYLERLDLTDVIVVAHSKGGLIAKSALAEADTVRRVRRVIAVNTPFGGSRYAYLFLIPSVRMFTPTGPVIRALQANLTLNSMISSLYSVFDPHIPETSHLDGAENIVLPSIGHFRPIADPDTLRTVDAIIGRATSEA
jgi:pimeloyl-ACP methyl ester carboxylesterase